MCVQIEIYETTKSRWDAQELLCLTTLNVNKHYLTLGLSVTKYVTHTIVWQPLGIESLLQLELELAIF